MNETNFLQRRKTMASTATVSTRSISQTQSPAIAGPVTLFGRLFFALIFLAAAPNHFASQTIAYAAAQGVPLASIAVPLSGVIALLGGLSILLGYHARIGAGLIALFLVGVTPMLHNFWAVADPMTRQIQMIMFMKNVSMLGGALLISQFGAGPWSLDARQKRA
jgi:putative oxidoreductase